jgi:hypothetical protein
MVLGSFLQQRWHETGGSWRVGEVVGTGNFFGYRGKDRLRTYQGLEGDEASPVAKFAGSRWSETVGISHRSSASGRRDLVRDKGVDLGQTETSGDVRDTDCGCPGHLPSSESTVFFVGDCGLRRKILGSLGALWRNWKRGNGEGRGGYL